MNTAEQWKLLALEKQSYTQYSVLTSDPTSPFNLRRKRFPTTNRVCKAQGQTHKRVGIYRPSPVFPKTGAIWHSPDPTYDSIPVAGFEGRRQRIRNDKYITLDFLY